MPVWIEAWGVPAVVVNGQWLSRDPVTQDVLVILTERIVGEQGRPFGSDQELARYMAEHTFRGRLLTAGGTAADPQ